MQPSDPILYPRVHLAEEYALLVTLGDGPFFKYQYSPEHPKPFFNPVYGPSGAEVTQNGHPTDPIGHRHHRSIWIGHRDVNGVNFWEENDSQSGQIFHINFTGLEEAPGVVRIVEENHWLSTRAGLVMEETREILIPPASPRLRLIDLRLAFTGGPREIQLGQTPLGFLGVRVAPKMSVLQGGRIHSPGGEGTESEVLGLRGEWMEYGGPVQPDVWETIGIIDEDENPRFPAIWQCRDDGWFGPALTRNAPYVIPSGKTLSLRYLLVFRCAEVDESEVQSLTETVEEIAALVGGIHDEMPEPGASAG